jgi:cysteine synthase A
MTIYKTEGRGQLYNDIVETVGDTPCVRLNRTGPDHVSIFVKVESFNPLSSIKDRLALNIIESAEREGHLKPGQTVVEAYLGKYRHWSCDGLCSQRLSACHHHG